MQNAMLELVYNICCIAICFATGYFFGLFQFMTAPPKWDKE